jgi:molecular chaperone GrpE
MTSKDHHHKAGSTASLKNKLHNNEATDANVEEEQTELLEHPSYEELLNKYTEVEEKVTQHYERMLRMQADADNMQRRVERDIANAHKYGLEKLILELLPVIDSLERATAIPDQPESVLEGVNLTLQMFAAALEKFGVQQVDPLSQAFNPELHQAVSTQPEPNVKPGTVLSVLQKGYLLNNRLIRPALVVVSKVS